MDLNFKRPPVLVLECRIVNNL